MPEQSPSYSEELEMRVLAEFPAHNPMSNVIVERLANAKYLGDLLDQDISIAKSYLTTETMRDNALVALDEDVDNNERWAKALEVLHAVKLVNKRVQRIGLLKQDAETEYMERIDPE